MKIELLIIGDEVTTGETKDTNSSMICKELNKSGFLVEQITIIGDKKDKLLQTLEEIYKRADLVITTGGLGPTSDDITKITLTEFFKTKLVFSQEIYNHIKTIYIQKNIVLPETGKTLGLVPENAEIILNPVGTASVLWFRDNNKQLIALPGVPHETHYIFPKLIIPKLGKNKNFKIIHKNIRVAGLREAVIADMLFDIEKRLPENIKLSYLPYLSTVKLRLSICTNNTKDEEMLDYVINSIKNCLKEYIYGYDEDTPEKIVLKLLKKYNLSLSLAESCSGGYLSHQITEIPGCSQWFKGGITVYSNKSKNEILGISNKLIEKHGAVSKEVVIAMQKAVLKRFNSELSISTSGIAGPEGGCPEKPVGTVWIAAGDSKNIISKKYMFGNQRHENIVNTSLVGFDMLRRFILEYKT